MKQIITLLLYWVVIHCTSSAQDRQAALDKYFSALSINQGFTGNVLISENGKVVYEKSFGYADPETKRLNTIKTLFPVCSITKTFIATAILQLQEKGKLNINDSVIKYLPDFIYTGITIKQLMSHTSGLPAFYGSFDSLLQAHPDTVWTNKDFIHCYRAAHQPLQFVPGTRFNYNNANFVVLSILVAIVSGIDTQAYLSKYIWKPAGMKHSFQKDIFLLTEADKMKAQMAIPYYWPHLYSDELVRTDSISYLVKDAAHNQFSGYGDMVSTLHDLLLYDDALYQGKLLKPSTLQTAFTPVRFNNGDINPGTWGLGWQIDKVGKMVNHGGGMAGMYLSFTRDIEKHQTAIVFSISRELLSRPVANNALKILNGEQIIPKKSLAYAYGKILIKEGAQQASRFLDSAKKNMDQYDINENEFNALGYDLLGDRFNYHLPNLHHYPEALEVFRINTIFFPGSANVYDSYAEALAKTGQKGAAINMYKKSLALNPNNTGAIEMLKKLE